MHVGVHCPLIQYSSEPVKKNKDFLRLMLGVFVSHDFWCVDRRAMLFLQEIFDRFDASSQAYLALFRTHYGKLPQ